MHGEYELEVIKKKTTEQDLEESKKAIENFLGIKIPKGVCLCEDVRGGVSIMPTSDVDEEEYMNFCFEMDKHLEPIEGCTPYERGTLRKTCSGKYIKG